MGKLVTCFLLTLTFHLRLQDATLTQYSGYSEDEIQPVFLLMLEYLIRPVAHEAFFKKYASKKFLKGRKDLNSTHLSYHD